MNSRGDFHFVFLQLFNVFTWFYMTLMMINKIPSDIGITSALRIVFYINIIGSSLAGSILTEKISRFRMFSLWVALGISSSALLAFGYCVPANGYYVTVFTLLGISFGLGMPQSLGSLADFTAIENRGRISAIIFWAANLVSLPLAVLLMSFDLPTCSIVLALWRALGLASLLVAKPNSETVMRKSMQIKLRSILGERSIALYLVPWVMFNLIDAIEKAIFSSVQTNEFLNTLYVTEPIVASFSILVAGWLCDRIGRKRVILYGFVSLGVAYAVIGIFPLAEPAKWFYLVVDAIATGILWIAFILILWGDLSREGEREKYYVIGSIPFFAREIISFLAASMVGAAFMVGQVEKMNAAFSYASFFLFLSVLPLVYAPETLPEKNIELRRVKGYIERAKKMKDKYIRKT